MTTGSESFQRVFDILRVQCPKSGKEKVASLSYDLIFLLAGLRLGLLIDITILSEQSAKALSVALSKEAILENIIVIFEISSQQTFLVNRLLFRSQRQDMEYVAIGGTSPIQLSERPPYLIILIESLIAMKDSNFISFDIKSSVKDEIWFNSTLISLAGYLLDYSIVYTLLNDDLSLPNQENCLGDRDLILIKIDCSNSNGGMNSLLSFSCPQSIASPNLVGNCKNKFENRLKDIDSIASEICSEILVRSEVVRMSRFAL